jgi:hypothetical protein
MDYGEVTEIVNRPEVNPPQTRKSVANQTGELLDRPGVARGGLWLSAAAVLAADLPWGDFQGHTHWQTVAWIPFVSPPVRPIDVLQNVLLLVPLGFFCGVGARTASSALWRALSLGFLLSLAGEWTQLYSHLRFPSATDLAANVMGAALGAALALSVRRSTGCRS